VRVREPRPTAYGGHGPAATPGHLLTTGRRRTLEKHLRFLFIGYCDDPCTAVIPPRVKKITTMEKTVRFLRAFRLSFDRFSSRSIFVAACTEYIFVYRLTARVLGYIGREKIGIAQGKNRFDDNLMTEQ